MNTKYRQSNAARSLEFSNFFRIAMPCVLSYMVSVISFLVILPQKSVQISILTLCSRLNPKTIRMGHERVNNS